MLFERGNAGRWNYSRKEKAHLLWGVDFALGGMGNAVVPVIIHETFL